MKRLAIAGSVALALAGGITVVHTTADAQARKRVRRQNEKNLVVTLVTPTLNQEVQPDLSDPGLNGVVTVHFSSPIRKRDVIDNQNAFNRLTSKVEFNDSSFDRLAGTPTVRRNQLIFNPRTAENGGILPQGQYTLNIKRSLRNRGGRQLNGGREDFTTTFSVGTDVNGPVLRKMAPIDGQTNIGLQQRIVATFNEPIDPSSVISSIQVQDASTNPPSAIPAAGGGTGVTLERDGFDLVFTPSPCFGYPPQTTIQFLMQGRDAAGTAAPVSDRFGNAFARDPGLQWSFNAAAGAWESPNGSYNETTGVFRTQFQTKGVTPPPAALAPGSPQFTITPFATPCATASFFAPSCYSTGRVLIASNGTGLFEINLTGFINRFNQGVTDFSLISTIAPGPVRIGRPLGMIADPRWDPTTLHTFLYVVDQRTASVLVLDSRNLQVLGRFTGFSSPRDVGISTDTGLARSTMYVSDFAANNLVAIDLQGLTVNFNGQPGAPSPCEAIKDNQEFRTIIPTGRGPTSVVADSYLLNRVLVTNTLDSSVSVIRVLDNGLIGEFDTGSNPVDADFSLFGFGTFNVAMIACQGGLNDPDGAINLYLEGTGQDGVVATYSDNIKNPTAVWGNQQWAVGGNSTPQVWYAANTGSNSIVDLRISVTGGFGASITPAAVQVREVGPNPTFATLDPFYPNAFLFAAVAGTGSIAAMDPARPVPATNVFVGAIRRYMTAFTH